jgi:hypothetical protein
LEPFRLNGSWGSGLNEDLHPSRMGCNSQCGCWLVPSRTLNLHIPKPLAMFFNGFFTLLIGSRPNSGFSSVHNLQFGCLALGIQINIHTQNLQYPSWLAGLTKIILFLDILKFPKKRPDWHMVLRKTRNWLHNLLWNCQFSTENHWNFFGTKITTKRNRAFFDSEFFI